MHRNLHLCCSLVIALGLTSTSSALAAELVVLTPMMAGGKAVLRAGPKGEPQTTILQRAPADAITKAIAAETTRGTLKFMLQLDEQAQRIAGATTPAPTYLLRSPEDGGFAKRGFWLSEANKVSWHADPYVDLVVDKQNIEDGGFEEIFSHEMGHVLLRRLVPKLPNGSSRTPHSSLAITDYPTAFDEGFAIHFQSVARLLTQNERLKAIDRGLEYKPFLPNWASNVDRSLRIRGVRENLFVHQQLPVALDVGDASSLFDLTHLKNGQQMLSSEGVVATLFYHLLVQSNDTAATRTERYKSLLNSLRAFNGQRLTSGNANFLTFAQAHIERVPDAKTQWLTTILNLTYGATATAGVLREFPKLSSLGQEGRGEEYQVSLKQSRATLASQIDQVTRNPQRLNAAVGPELWLGVQPSSDKILTINLNTAEKTSLMKVLDFDSMDADLLLADRASRGPFASVDDFTTRRKSAPLLRKRFNEAHELATKLGGFERE